MPVRSFTRRQFLKGTAVGALGLGCAPTWLRAGANAATRPNVLLVFPDQLRFDWTGFTAGLPVRTPNLVRLAEEGMRFDRAYCPSPLCAPSRASLATGRAYGRTGVATNKDILADVETVYTRLRDAGYRVGSTGKLDLRKPAYSWGPDGQHRVDGRHYFREWGFTDGLDSEGKGDTLKGGTRLREPIGPYMKMLRDRGDGSLERYIQWRENRRRAGRPAPNYSYTEPVQIADELYNDNWVGRQALELLTEFPTNQPWFLQVNFPGPHAPMDVTPAMKAWYRDTTFPLPLNNTELTPEEHQETRRAYSAMVENIDHWLGRYLDELERRGELDRTLVVFSSDHGDMLGDHGQWGKRSPLQPSVSVPLVMRGPDVRRGATHRGAVSTLDLTATFLDYAGAAALPEMDCRSLRPLLRAGGAAEPTLATAGYGGWRMVTDGRYKLIRGFNPAAVSRTDYDGDDDDAAAGESERSPVLFDLDNDPHEQTDVAARLPDIVARLEKHLPIA
jgi:Arylsulfatase A and related enzymes